MSFYFFTVSFAVKTKEKKIKRLAFCPLVVIKRYFAHCTTVLAVYTGDRCVKQTKTLVICHPLTVVANLCSNLLYTTLSVKFICDCMS